MAANGLLHAQQYTSVQEGTLTKSLILKAHQAKSAISTQSPQCCECRPFSVGLGVREYLQRAESSKEEECAQSTGVAIVLHVLHA